MRAQRNIVPVSTKARSLRRMFEEESMKTNDTNDDESLDHDMLELAALEDKIHANAEHISNLFEHLGILEGIRSTLNSFRKRLQEIECLLLEVRRDMGSFLYGHMYCAAIGAYECLMHDVMDVLIDSDTFSKSALTYLAGQDRDSHDAVKLGLKKKPIRTREDARDRFRRATLIDAEMIATTVKRLFDLDFPVPVDSKKMARLRNLFAHNGGVKPDGSVEHMSKDRVLDLVQQLDELVGETTMRINAAIESVSRKQESN
ncbi:hypothetical protein R69658_01640 [Paraburkholderia aspalathi]|uniref:RiboL-PSP-HEPN domain-containing protein n=2 Tax=Paraburkholderia aspalathi TaxID=1324617 RepID=A0ABM8R1B0_9BURK|nr:hypothetical protein R69658_01640 [Paraburkholderia aspalathi]